MQNIEPYYNWRHLYIASNDKKSPFSLYQNSEVYYTHSLYNFIIHPQWDSIGSETLFVKVLFTNYEKKFVVIELLGEWNDCLNNDIMHLKNKVLHQMIKEGIIYFILLGENVLNFHYSDDCYYEEWHQEINKGWIALINFRDDIMNEIKLANINKHLIRETPLPYINWRTLNPNQLFNFTKQFSPSKITS